MWKRFDPEQHSGQASLQLPLDALLLLMSAAAVWWVRHAGAAEQLPVFPAQGEFLFDSQPAADAVVVLYPVDRAGGQSSFFRPRGVVRADGRFRLSTYSTDDGAPAGEYAVTVTWRPHIIDGDDYRPGPNVLPERYARPETTPLRVKIGPGTNELPPLLITVGHQFGHAA